MAHWSFHSISESSSPRGNFDPVIKPKERGKLGNKQNADVPLTPHYIRVASISKQIELRRYFLNHSKDIFFCCVFLCVCSSFII